jgi:hypothetical protein
MFSADKTVKEFFAQCNDPSLTPMEQIALFRKLLVEYRNLVGTSDLFRIALTDDGSYTLDERLAAYERYSDTLGIDRNTDKLYHSILELIQMDKKNENQ